MTESTNRNYIEKNRLSWNAKTDVHMQSGFYDLEGFLKGESSLNEIEIQLLGDVKGKSILHLQCHFGQDSISLSRMGASVTGVDLSDVAVKRAIELAKQTTAEAEFVCCDIYDLPQHLNKKFDIVFTSYGVIGWLPDLDRWAKIISLFLKPGGQFVMVEFHPVVWMFDNDFQKIEYSYFNVDAIVEMESGTYADRNAPIKHESVSWNHSLGEVFNSLIKNGLAVTSFDEFDYSPYACFKHTLEIAPEKFRIRHLDKKLPMLYSLTAVKS